MRTVTRSSTATTPADNRILERDSLGNTVTRTFDANNQVLTQTRYTTPDRTGWIRAAPAT